jgi:hypothetical protein
MGGTMSYTSHVLEVPSDVGFAMNTSSLPYLPELQPQFSVSVSPTH